MVSIVMHFLQTNLTSLWCGLKLGVAGNFLSFPFLFGKVVFCQIVASAIANSQWSIQILSFCFSFCLFTGVICISICDICPKKNVHKILGSRNLVEPSANDRLKTSHLLLLDLYKRVVLLSITTWYFMEVLIVYLVLPVVRYSWLVVYWFWLLSMKYHGGTNFGRTAGGPFITTSYDYDAPIDEYGKLTRKKFSRIFQMCVVASFISIKCINIPFF